MRRTPALPARAPVRALFALAVALCLVSGLFTRLPAARAGDSTLPRYALIPVAERVYALPAPYTFDKACGPSTSDFQPDGPRVRFVGAFAPSGSTEKTLSLRRQGASCEDVKLLLLQPTAGRLAATARWSARDPGYLDLVVQSKALADSAAIRGTIKLKLRSIQTAAPNDATWIPDRDDRAVYRFTLPETDLIALFPQKQIVVDVESDAVKGAPQEYQSFVDEAGETIDRRALESFTVAQAWSVAPEESALLVVAAAPDPSKGFTVTISDPRAVMLDAGEVTCAGTGQAKCALSRSADRKLVLTVPPGIYPTADVDPRPSTRKIDATQRIFAALQGMRATLNLEVSPARPLRWHYVTEDSPHDKSVVLTLPGTYVSCPAPDVTSSRSYLFERLPAPPYERALRVAVNDAGCADPSTAVIQVHGPLAVGSPTFNTTYELDKKLWLQPAKARNVLALRVGGPLASSDALRATTQFKVPGVTADGAWGACDGSACVYTLTATGEFTQPKVRLQVALPDEVPFATEMIYRSNGIALSSGALVLGDVSRWMLPARSVDVIVPIGVTAATRPRLPDDVGRLFTGGEVLKCGSGEECVEIRREAGDAAFAILKEAAVKKLASASAEISIPLSRSDLEVTSPAGAVTLTLRTTSCEYDFQQLTRVISGLADAEVLYRVKASSGECLCASFTATTPNNAALVDEIAWESPAAMDCKDVRGDVGRVLRAHLQRVDPVDADQPLSLTVSFAKGDPVPLARGQKGVSLKVERRFEPDKEIRLSIDAPAVGALESRVLRDQKHFAVDRRNRLFIPRRAVVPWTVRLRSLSYHRPGRVPADLNSGAVAYIPVEPDALPCADTEGGVECYLIGSAPTSAALGLTFSLRGKASDFWIDGAERDGAAALVRDASLRLGVVAHDLAGRETRSYRFSWDLAGASISCATPAWYRPARLTKNPIRGGDAVRVLNKEDYRTCKLRLPLDPAVKAEDLRRVIEMAGPQQLRITADLTVGTEPPESEEVERALTIDARRGDLSYEAATLDKEGHVVDRPAVVIPLRDDVLKVFKRSPSAGSRVDITVKHVPEAEATGALKGADPPTDDAGYASTLVVRTSILPLGGLRLYTYGADSNYGLRLYASAALQMTAYRSPQSGLKAATSSDYAKSTASPFKYGLIGVAEVWNFSAGQALIPVAAPQVHVGLLFPDQFNQEKWWREFSVAAGLGLRLPGYGTDAQVGAVVWYVYGLGARNNYGSWLFGLDVKLGAAGG